MTNQEAVQLAQRVFTPNARQQPIELVRGQGVHVWDAEGRRYLDMIGGVAVTILGHSHPALIEALHTQADLLWHSSNLFYNQPSLNLAERLCQLSFAKRVFFCNSGTEANEAAFKTARRYHWARGDR